MTWILYTTYSEIAASFVFVQILRKVSYEEVYFFLSVTVQEETSSTIKKIEDKIQGFPMNFSELVETSTIIINHCCSRKTIAAHQAEVC